MQLENSCVVFDLETTGSNSDKDFVIEIGAVKLRHGKIVDEFHSFIACPQKLSEEVEHLTGIRNQDLAGAPYVEEVLNNFYRFADGCILAAYNLSFDWKFIKRNADICGLNFENDKIDILSLVQEELRGKIINYKLSVVAEHFGIVYNKGNVLSEAKTASEIMLKISGY